MTKQVVITEQARQVGKTAARRTPVLEQVQLFKSTWVGRQDQAVKVKTDEEAKVWRELAEIGLVLVSEKGSDTVVTLTNFGRELACTVPLFQPWQGEFLAAPAPAEAGKPGEREGLIALDKVPGTEVLDRWHLAQAQETPPAPRVPVAGVARLCAFLHDDLLLSEGQLAALLQVDRFTLRELIVSAEWTEDDRNSGWLGSWLAKLAECGGEAECHGDLHDRLHFWNDTVSLDKPYHGPVVCWVPKGDDAELELDFNRELLRDMVDAFNRTGRRATGGEPQ